MLLGGLDNGSEPLIVVSPPAVPNLGFSKETIGNETHSALYWNRIAVLLVRFATDLEINLPPDAGPETRLYRLGVIEYNQRVSGLLP
jgi:hypothetical protein